MIVRYLAYKRLISIKIDREQEPTDRNSFWKCENPIAPRLPMHMSVKSRTRPNGGRPSPPPLGRQAQFKASRCLHRRYIRPG